MYSPVLTWQHCLNVFCLLDYRLQLAKFASMNLPVDTPYCISKHDEINRPSLLGYGEFFYFLFCSHNTSHKYCTNKSMDKIQPLVLVDNYMAI
jgi:hypothetical protein